MTMGLISLWGIIIIIGICTKLYTKKKVADIDGWRGVHKRKKLNRGR